MTLRLSGQTLRVSPGRPTGQALRLRGAAPGLPVAIDVVDGGALQITGHTVNTGAPELPVRRRVRLHDQPSGRVVREVWSDAATGAYAFTQLRAGRYYVTSFDQTGQYNGVISTDVLPEPMPGAAP